MNTTKKNSKFACVELGTTKCALTIWDTNGRPKVLPNMDGELKTRSAIWYGPGCKERIFGDAAHRMQFVEPDRTVLRWKPYIGQAHVFFTDGNQKITPERCIEDMVGYLIQCARKYTGDPEAASELVLTVPSGYNEMQRQIVKKSAEKTGAKVILLVNEPTAAGLSYGIQKEPGDSLGMVFDAGGGTTDVTIVQYTGGEANVLASRGDNLLGGRDFDAVLLRMVVKAFKEKYGLDVSPKSHPRDWAVINDEVERQKHLLSVKSEVKIVARVDGQQIIIPVTRQSFREACKEYRERMKDLILQTIAEAKIDIKDLKNVLPVGGSSRVPWIQELLTEVFGEGRVRGGNVSPDLAIVEGGAVAAAKAATSDGTTIIDHQSLCVIEAPTIQSNDVCPVSLGVGVHEPHKGSIFTEETMVCSVIIERNTPLPCSAIQRYGALQDGQSRFNIKVLQGEEGKPIKECIVVGSRTVDFPPRNANQESIEVTMSYDSSGMTKVVVRDLISGRTEDITADFYSDKSKNQAA
jgi:molecular chaperone HscC